MDMGRHHIVFAGNRSHPEMEQRRQGLESALKSAGKGARIIDLDIPDFTFETGRAAMTGFLARPDARLNAVFAGSDAVAMGVVVALLDAKLRVPEDVSVIGYNDLPIAQYFQRPLTTVRQDTYQAGSLLVEKLFQIFDGGKPTSTTVTTELVIRQT
jgi:DNA-binding LacI/PurR family transcriptional regulator